MCPLRLRVVSAEIDAAFLKLGLKAGNIRFQAVD